MVADFILRAVSSDMVSDVCPRSQPVYFCAFEEEKFLIRTPVGMVYRNGVLFDNGVRMCSRVMVLGAFTRSKARDAEIVIIAGRMRAQDANLDSKYVRPSTRSSAVTNKHTVEVTSTEQTSQ